MSKEHHGELNSVFVAPPFGQFFRRKDVSPVLGSYTLQARPGRYLRALKTIRPLGNGNWVNQIGLRNPGIASLPLPVNDRSVLSIAAVTSEDWAHFAALIPALQSGSQYAALELNVSCPNVNRVAFSHEYLQHFKAAFPNVIVKLPPFLSSLAQIRHFMAGGVFTFHLSNTLPTRRGGLSGQLLKKMNLRLIQRARREFGQQIQIIAGGGIYHRQDVDDYARVGVDGMSLGTICYTPWRISAMIKYIKHYVPETMQCF